MISSARASGEYGKYMIFVTFLHFFRKTSLIRPSNRFSSCTVARCTPFWFCLEFKADKFCAWNSRQAEKSETSLKPVQWMNRISACHVTYNRTVIHNDHCDNKITFVRTRSLSNAITFSIQPTWRPLHEVMWRHRLRDQSIRHRPIPNGGLLELILYLLPL